MRILHIFDHSIPLHSGYSFRSKSILENQHKLGWETLHVTSSKHTAPGQNGEIVDGLKFYRTPDSKSFLSQLPVLNQYAVVRSLRKSIEALVLEHKPDLLQAHSPCLTGLAALPIARRYNIPIIYEVRAFWEDAAVDHGTTQEWSLRYRLTRALESYVLRQVDGVTTICAGLKNEMVGRGIAESKITIIPNAVDPDSFITPDITDNPLYSELNLAGCTVIGFVGSFYAYEGIDLLIQALPLIKQQGVNAKLLLVGGGPQEQNLKALSKRLQLENDVVFTGRVPHEQVPLYYDVTDVLAFPRYSMRLTELVTPLKPLETMALKKVFVASDVGGHRELIIDGVTGNLFASGSADALASAVVNLIEDRSNWPKRIDAGIDYIERERTWTRSVSNYKNLYESLL